MEDTIQSVFLQFINIAKNEGYDEADKYLKDIIDLGKDGFPNWLDHKNRSIIYYITSNFLEIEEYEKYIKLVVTNGENLNDNLGMVRNLDFIIDNNLYEHFKVLVSFGLDVDLMLYVNNSYQCTVLNFAVIKSNYEFVHFLLENYSDIVNSRDVDERTSLFLAIKNYEIIHLLLRHKANVTLIDCSGLDLFTYSYLEQGMSNNTTRLLEEGIIRIYTKTEENKSPLVHLMEIKQNEIDDLIIYLIDQYPPQTKEDIDAISDAFTLSIFSEKLMLFLLGKGANINHCFKGSCALKNAVKSNSVKMVQKLIDLGAKTNYPCYITYPFYEIIFPALYRNDENSKQIINILLENGARFDKVYTYEGIPTIFLFEIAQQEINEEFYDIIIESSQKLIEFKKPLPIAWVDNLDVSDVPCVTPVEFALIVGNTKFAQKLVEHGASLETPVYNDSNKRLYNSPLEMVMNLHANLDFIIPFFKFLYNYKKKTSIFGNINVYKNIINNLPGPNGPCTLFVVLGKSLELFEFLLINGANPNCENAEGLLVLQMAVKLRLIHYIEVLIESGADPFKENIHGLNTKDVLDEVKIIMTKEEFYKISSLLKKNQMIISSRQQFRMPSQKPNVTFYFDE